MENKALEAWRATFGAAAYNYWNRIDKFINVSPDMEQMPDEVYNSLEVQKVVSEYPSVSSHAIRRVVTAEWSWSVPSQEALDLIARYSPIVEVGAGRGYWAALLADRGVDIVCFDEHPPVNTEEAKQNHWHPSVGTFHDVEKAPAEVAGKYPDRSLMISWPPYGEPTDYGLSDYRKAGGQLVIYIGEGSGGCCGGDPFWEEINSYWRETEQQMALPQWEGLHDWLVIYERAPMLESHR